MFLDVAEVSFGYSCGMRIVHCRQPSVKRRVGAQPEAGAGAGAGSWSIYFFKKKNAVVGLRLELGLG